LKATATKCRVRIEFFSPAGICQTHLSLVIWI
jgi:hypothetical protein